MNNQGTPQVHNFRAYAGSVKAHEGSETAPAPPQFET